MRVSRRKAVEVAGLVSQAEAPAGTERTASLQRSFPGFAVNTELRRVDCISWWLVGLQDFHLGRDVIGLVVWEVSSDSEAGLKGQEMGVLGCDLRKRWSGHVRGWKEESGRMCRTKDCKQQRACVEQEPGNIDGVMK